MITEEEEEGMEDSRTMDFGLRALELGEEGFTGVKV